MPIKFSVVIPCYNQAKYLRDCYLSLISQRHRNWEAIIINDGSTDETETVINQITRFDKRVQTFIQPNGGLSSARNLGIKNITGDYVIFLDADDMLLPDCLSHIQNEILKNPTVQLLQVGYRHISQNGNAVYQIVNPIAKKYLFPEILFNNIGPVHSLCIEHTLLQKIGYFDETLKSCEDWDYWIRVSFVHNEITTIQEPLVDYRMNNNSMSRNSFTLYNAMKKVLIRGKNLYMKNYLHTNKIDIESTFKNSLKNKLAICLGVGILQNKIEETTSLFEEETKKNNLHFIPSDFKLMSSYLTFRYQDLDDDVIKILKNYKPQYVHFFQKIGYTKTIIRQCIWAIFSKHYHIYYRKKLGYLGILLHKLKAQTA